MALNTFDNSMFSGLGDQEKPVEKPIQKKKDEVKPSESASSNGLPKTQPTGGSKPFRIDLKRSSYNEPAPVTPPKPAAIKPAPAPTAPRTVTEQEKEKIQKAIENAPKPEPSAPQGIFTTPAALYESAQRQYKSSFDKVKELDNKYKKAEQSWKASNPFWTGQRTKVEADKPWMTQQEKSEYKALQQQYQQNKANAEKRRYEVSSTINDDINNTLMSSAESLDFNKVKTLESGSKAYSGAFNLSKQGVNMRVPDAAKIDAEAKKIASKYGMPDDGYFYQDIKNQLTGAVDAGLAQPKIDEEANKLFKKETGKTIAEYISSLEKQNQDQFGKAVKSNSKVSAAIAKADSTARALQESIVEKSKAEYEKQDVDYKQKADAIQNSAANNENFKAVVKAVEEKEYQRVNEEVKAGRMTVDQAKEYIGSNTYLETITNNPLIKEAYESIVTPEFKRLYDDYLLERKGLNARVNARYNRQIREGNAQLKAEVDRLSEEIARDFKGADVDKALLQKIYKQAAQNVQKSKEAKVESIENSRGWFENFYNQGMMSMGGAIKNYGSAFGDDRMRLLGEDLENTYFTTTSPEFNSWYDYLNATKTALAAGNFIGRMVPGTAAAVTATALISSGVGSPTAAMIIGGIVNLASESIDMSENMYQEVYAQTGDPVKAAAAAGKVNEVNMGLAIKAPLAMVPFFKIPVKGFLPKIGIAATSETLDELVDEIYQGTNENFIREQVLDKDVDPLKLELTFNFKPEEIKRTAMNIVPMTLVFGGGSQSVSASFEKLSEFRTNRAAQEFAAKVDLSDVSSSNVSQFMYSVYLKKGEAFTTSLPDVLLANDVIDENTRKEMLARVEQFKELEDIYSSMNIPKEDILTRMAGLRTYEQMMDAKEAVRLEMEKNGGVSTPVTKAMEKALAKAESTFSGVLSKESPNMVVMSMPSGETYLYTPDEALAALEKDNIKKMVAEGSIALNVLGSSSNKEYAPVMAAVENILKSTEKPAAETVAQEGKAVETAKAPAEKGAVTTTQPENAVQVETAGQVPVQPEAAVGEQVAQGEPQAEPQEVAKEGEQGKVTPTEEITGAVEKPKGKWSPSETIAKLRERQKEFAGNNVNKAAESINKALESSNVKAEVIESEAEWNKVTGGQARDNSGIFISQDGSGKIYINRQKLQKGFETTVVWHEGTHPVINIIRNTNKPLYDKMVKGLDKAKRSATGKTKASLDQILNWVETQYAEDGDLTIEDESIVEVIAMIADGRLKLDEMPKSVAQTIIDFINSMAEFLGLPTVLPDTDLKTFMDTASAISEALITGKDMASIVGAENVGKFEFTKPGGQSRRISAEQVFKREEVKKGKKKVMDVAKEFEKAVDDVIEPSADADAKMTRFLTNAYEDLRYFLSDFEGDVGLDWYTNKMREFDEKLMEASDIAIERGDMPAENSLRDADNMDLFKAVLALSSTGENPKNNTRAAFNIWKNFNRAEMAFEKYQPGQVSLRTKEPERTADGKEKIDKKTGKVIYKAPSGPIVRENTRTVTIQVGKKEVTIKKSDLRPAFMVEYNFTDAKGKTVVKTPKDEVRLWKETDKFYFFGSPSDKAGLLKIAKSDMLMMEPEDNGITGKGWTARGGAVAANLEKLEMLMQDHGGIVGAVEWLKGKHGIEELRKYNAGVPDVNGKKGMNPEGERYGSFIFGEKLGPFHQNVSGVPTELTMDLWWSRTWNRYMGTLITKGANEKVDIQEVPRNDAERNIMREAARLAADDLGLEVHELQAALWYMEQQMYKRMGAAVESYSFVDGINEILKNYGKKDEELRSENYGVDSTEADRKRQDAVTKLNARLAGEGVKIRKGEGGRVEVQREDGGVERQASKAAPRGEAAPVVWSEKIDEIQSLPISEEGGSTLNVDGTEYTGGGLIVPIDSVNLTQGTLTKEAILDFIEKNKEKIGSESVKVGLYKFENDDKVSIDLNLVVPPKYTDVALEFGRLAGQESLFNLDTFKNIKTGSDGKDPRSFTAEEFNEISRSLAEGKMPNVSGMPGYIQESKSATRTVGKDKIKGTYMEPFMTSSGNDYIFFHSSRADLKSIMKGIDSSKHYNTHTSRQEKGLQYGIASYYTQPTDSERMVSGDRYVVRVPKDKVYPMNIDPNGYRAAAEKKYDESYPFRREWIRKFIADKAKRDGFQMMVGDWGIDITGKKIDTGIPNLRADAVVPLKPTKEDSSKFKSNIEKGMPLTEHPELASYKLEKPSEALAKSIYDYLSKKGFDETYKKKRDLIKKLESVAITLPEFDYLTEGLPDRFNDRVTKLRAALESIQPKEKPTTAKRTRQRSSSAERYGSREEMFETHKLYVDLATEAINAGVETYQDFLDGLDEAKTSLSENAWRDAKRIAQGKKPMINGPEDINKGKKKSLANRAFEGGSQEAVKDAIYEFGLEYDPISNESAYESASQFIDKVGIDDALIAANNGMISGSMQAFVYSIAIDRVGAEMAVETDPVKQMELISKQASIIDAFDMKARDGGRFVQALSYVYKNSDFPYTYEYAVKALVEANAGMDISTEMKGMINSLVSQIGDLNKRIKEQETKLQEAMERDAVAKIVDAVVNEKKTSKEKSSYKKIADKIREGKINRPGMFMASSPAAVAWDAALETAATIIETGGKLADAVAEGIMRMRQSEWYKSADEKTRKDGEKVFTDYMVESSSKENLKAPVKPTVDADGNINIPFSFLRQLVKDGVTTIEDMTAAILETLSIEYEGITERQVRDAITKYGQQKFPSKDEVLRKLAEMKRDGQLLSALEDVESGKFPAKSGFQREKPTDKQRELTRKIKDRMKDIPEDQEQIEKNWASAQTRIKTILENRIADLNAQIAAGQREPRNRKQTDLNEENKLLKAEVARLNEVLDGLVGKVEVSHETKVKNALKAIEKASQDIQDMIAKSDIGYKEKRAKLEDPRLTAAREQLDAMRDTLAQMREEQGIAEARRIAMYKERLKQDIKEMQRKLDEGDYAKKESRDLSMIDDEVKRMRAEKMKLKNKIDIEKEKLRLKNRTILEKSLDIIVDVVNIPRSMLASMDLSGLLRQGLITSLRNPGIAAAAFVESLRFATSKVSFERYIELLESTPEYMVMKEAGLFLSTPSAELAAREEQFLSNLAEKIPGYGTILIAGTQRAYTGFLNKLRADVFMAFHKQLLAEGYTGTELMENLKSFAQFINQSTGRGTFGKRGDAVLGNASQLFFAPRYIASRINVLARTATLGYGMPKAARIEMLKTMGTYLGLGTLTLALAAAAGAEVEDDPRSSDFGKIKVGDLRFDIWAGLQQVVVLASRLATMETKRTSTGEVVPFYSGGWNSQTMMSTLGDFLENKVSPPVAIFMDFDSKDNTFKFDKKLFGMELAKKGEEFNITDAILGNISPIWLNDIAEINREQGLPSAVAAGTGSFFGLGVSYYGPGIKDKVQNDIYQYFNENPPDWGSQQYMRSYNSFIEDSIIPKYEADPDFNDDIISTAERVADVLNATNDKPTWYRDAFYASTNDRRLKIILSNTQGLSKKELEKTVDELYELGIISDEFYSERIDPLLEK